MKKALMVLLLTGCGDKDPCPVTPQFWTELGIGIYVEPDAADWTTYSDLSARVDAMAQIVATYAERPVTDLQGWTIIFRNVYLFSCADTDRAVGCEHPSGWIEVVTSNYRPCLEETVLPHELLHAFGYGGHDDPKWYDWQYVADSLIALNPTYPTTEGPKACTVFASRWIPN